MRNLVDDLANEEVKALALLEAIGRYKDEIVQCDVRITELSAKIAEVEKAWNYEQLTSDSINVDPLRRICISIEGYEKAMADGRATVDPAELLKLAEVRDFMYALEKNKD